MSNTQKLKMGVDFLMSAALLLLMAYELIGQLTHEIIGSALFLLFIAHHLLNRKWLQSLFKDRYSPLRAAQTALVLLLCICMLLQMASGILLSRHLFTFLQIRGYTRLARTLHMLCTYWGLVLMGLHLGLHGQLMLSAARRLAGPRSAARTALLRLAGAAVAGWGVYAFFRRQIGPYLLAQIPFAFFDFEEPLIFFFADYLAIMGLFVFLGHYLAAGLRRLSAKRR